MVLREALEGQLTRRGVHNHATVESISNQLLIRWKEVLKHLLRVSQELIAKIVELLNVGRLHSHSVPLKHHQRLVLQVEQLRANVAQLVENCEVFN